MKLSWAMTTKLCRNSKPVNSLNWFVKVRRGGTFKLLDDDLRSDCIDDFTLSSSEKRSHFDLNNWFFIYLIYIIATLTQSRGLASKTWNKNNFTSTLWEQSFEKYCRLGKKKYDDREYICFFPGTWSVWPNCCHFSVHQDQLLNGQRCNSYGALISIAH